MTKNKSKPHYINRDISWLSFNERVLQEAQDERNPLIERIKFLGIFSNNRDEFFRVRVATLKRMVKLGKKARIYIPEDPAEVLAKIQKIVIDQQQRFDHCYQLIRQDLEQHHVHIITEQQLNDEQARYVRHYFRNEVLPKLVPLMLDAKKEFPYLKDKSSYLLVRMRLPKKVTKLALIEIPTSVVNRFVVLPSQLPHKYIMLLDDVIRHCLNDIFAIFEYESIESYTIKLTRDAELDIDTDLSQSFVEKVTKSLKKRKKGQPVRLVYDSSIAPDLLRFVMKQINLNKDDNPIPGGRYHNFKDFMSFPDLGMAQLVNPPLTPIEHPELDIHTSLFKVIKRKDILLSFPYQSYYPIIDLLREASIDPKVVSIQTTMYRVAKNSSMMNALINAIKNGKEVTVVVELRARFDEESNIYWANKLQEEGARVIFGVPNLKVHSKLFLISRKEHHQLVHYAHIGTGNFNENTARVYTDHSLLTADERITKEVAQVFDFYADNLKVGHYKHLMVAPFFMRKRLTQLVQKEIDNAKVGKEAYMLLKMNSLVDEELIKKLYEASKAGVKIRCIVRGICGLETGTANSENIEIISIVDRFLEHARVFVFCNGGDEKYFLSSGDWMIRNLDHRSEVAVPIYNKEIQQEIKKMLELQWTDNVKARWINKKQDNAYRMSGADMPLRAQYAIYQHLKLTYEKLPGLTTLRPRKSVQPVKRKTTKRKTTKE